MITERDSNQSERANQTFFRFDVRSSPRFPASLLARTREATERLNYFRTEVPFGNKEDSQNSPSISDRVYVTLLENSIDDTSGTCRERGHSAEERVNWKEETVGEKVHYFSSFFFSRSLLPPEEAEEKEEDVSKGRRRTRKRTDENSGASSRNDRKVSSGEELEAKPDGGFRGIREKGALANYVGWTIAVGAAEIVKRYCHKEG